MWGHGGDIESLERKKQEFIDFSANINPLGQPDSVRAAIENSAEASLNYPDPFQRKLKEAISEFEKIPSEQIVCGNGAAEIIFKLIQHFSPKKAMLLAPTFSEYENALRQFGAEVTYHYLEKSENFRLNERILASLKGIDILFLCNPNNPTGSLIDPLLMIKILKKCEAEGIVLVVDECFIDFVLPANQSLKNKLKDFHNLIIIKAFTKSFAIPGIRLGYCLVRSPQIAEKLSNIGPPWSVSVPAQLAGIAGAKEEAFLEKTRAFVAEERNFLEKELEKLRIKAYPSEANFIFFESSTESLREKLLESGIVIRDCSNYIGLSKGYYRIAVKTREENIKFIEGIERVLCHE